jgi:hypothetical protein
MGYSGSERLRRQPRSCARRSDDTDARNTAVAVLIPANPGPGRCGACGHHGRCDRARPRGVCHGRQIHPILARANIKPLPDTWSPCPATGPAAGRVAARRMGRENRGSGRPEGADAPERAATATSPTTGKRRPSRPPRSERPPAEAHVGPPARGSGRGNRNPHRPVRGPGRRSLSRPFATRATGRFTVTSTGDGNEPRILV